MSIDVPDGRGYLVTDNGADGKPMTLHSATRLMWWRDDGRLWVVSDYEVTPERLTQLTLEIQPGSGLPYVIPSAGTTLVGFNTFESYESVRQDWSLDGAFLELAVTSGGLAQQLADVAAVSVVERTIAGAAGYAITLPNGQVNLMWPTANADHWGSLIVAAPLVPPPRRDRRSNHTYLNIQAFIFEVHQRRMSRLGSSIGAYHPCSNVRLVMPRCTRSQMAQSCRLTMCQKSTASDGSKSILATSSGWNSNWQSINVWSAASGRRMNAATWSRDSESIKLG